MSIDLKNIFFCQLVKNDQDELIIENYQTEAPINAGTEHIVHSVHNTFISKPTRGYGVFKPESTVQWALRHKPKFDEQAEISSVRLRDELTKYPFSDTGVLMFARYQSLATEYMMITLIPKTQAIDLSNKPSISPISYLDIQGITLAARINLTEFQINSETGRYVQFLKGRAGRGVSDFFIDFLGLEITLDKKHQNQVLMQAVEDYVNSICENDERPFLLKAAKDFCFDTDKSGDEITLEALSVELGGIAESNLKDYIMDNGYELADSIPIDKTVIEKLVKFKGAGGGLNISFDRLLLGERVFYDAETDTLTIKGTPPNLKDQITRA